MLLVAPVAFTAGVEQAPHVSLHPVTLDWLKLGAMVEVRGITVMHLETIQKW